MASESKQKIRKSEFQALIEKSDSQERRKNWIEIAKAFLLPLSLTLISIGATYSVNKQQDKNAIYLAEQQIKSANIIAKANREHSARISESDQRIERIKHIKDIFKAILSEDDKDSDAIKMHIRSLEIFKGDALSFLLNIKEHFKNQISHEAFKSQGKNKTMEDLVAQTDKSILNILKNSQIDVSGRIFVNSGKDDPKLIQIKASALSTEIFREKIPSGITLDHYKKLISGTHTSNMRKQRYENYNFSNCIFINTKLYQADFSGCTLKNSIFMYVDNHEASFSESDLSGAVFINCNLKRVNFMKSKVKNTRFLYPILKLGDKEKKFLSRQGFYCELEDARFALGTLMYTQAPPFDLLKNLEKSEMGQAFYPLYINLLSPHKQRIEEMEASQDEKWKALLKMLGGDYAKFHRDLMKEKRRLEKHSYQKKKTTQAYVPRVTGA
jgi:hypothetical protein